MRILLLAQYFKPESVGAAIWIHELATDLVGKGHQVTMLTAFPNYPSGVIFDGYRGEVFQRETIDGVEVIWIDQQNVHRGSISMPRRRILRLNTDPATAKKVASDGRECKWNRKYPAAPNHLALLGVG